MENSNNNNNKISLGQSGGKIRFRELSTDETTGKKQMSCHTDSDKKSHKLWFEINKWYSEVSLLLPYVELIMQQQQQPQSLP